MTPSTPAPTDAGALADEMFGHAEKAYFKACETSDPQHWMEAALLAQQHRNALIAARKASPQETRGDEPLYRRVITKDRIWYEPAASKQSPLLEREGIAQKLNDVRCARRGASLSRFTNESSEVVEELLAQADAVLALLSPDTTVVSSTDWLKGLNDYHDHHPLSSKNRGAE